MKQITKYLQETLQLIPDWDCNDYYYGDSNIEVLHDKVWICIQHIYGAYVVLIAPINEAAIKKTLQTEEDVIELFNSVSLIIS